MRPTTKSTLSIKCSNSIIMKQISETIYRSAGIFTRRFIWDNEIEYRIGCANDSFMVIRHEAKKPNY